MARYDHLELVRLPEQFERRKLGGGGPPPARDRDQHSTKLRDELNAATQAQRGRRKPEFVDPSLILRVQMTGALLEEDWERLGLTVLSSDADRTLVLFASNEDMQDFRARLDAYQRGAPPGQKHAPYNNFVAGIESIGSVEPRDRIGSRFQEEGFADLNDFVPQTSYLIDIELWDLGERRLRERKIEEVIRYVEARAGEVLDRYIGPSISMFRARLTGELIRTLLTIEEVATIDLPPAPDVTTAEALDLTLADAPALNALAEDAPLIGIIDSGVNDHPFLADIVAGAIGVPADLGTADVWGHGTRVAGVAAFGDLRAQLAVGALQRGARICAAKVVNDRGDFDDRRLVPSQMREAITTLNLRFGCRIFVVALADRRRVFDGGKVGTWAATLDELARELDVVIIVSSGNRSPRGGNRLEQAVTEYPRYLLEDANRFFEPAGALNVITVGALAHGEGLDPDRAEDVGVRPITLLHEPAPFSRIGPGPGGATKPDVVEIGGTLIFDPIVARLRGGEDVGSAGVLTLYHSYLDRLFTAGSGTSYAAPRVAFSAAQILTRFPHASANLVRALIVGSAEIPQPAQERLQLLGVDATRAICGHGLVDLERAAFSDDARVTLYAEDELALDHFAVYRIPIPEAFQAGNGERCIRVTLAFDPPVRHTRTDYAGVGMSFRLIRGCQPDLIFEHYRKREQDDGPFPELAGRYNCNLVPGPQAREKGTVQSATVTFKRGIEDYGDSYYLVVRCESGWATHVDRQQFAVVIELLQKAEVQLYERVRQRLRLQA
ncbi:S8 family peptidase (plasmid) [Bradyrhizobium sp. 41S5]|uniref:S8 family peptidase n=1 Tax=Bradyrhizobium sp. 41S5 TaxID=1404443 RepID=UPI001E4E2A2A|nr:S8 family peptidase [Bradyrhizobium sp. 41S5]UFX49437.1 S8 family peptidase [Bradyrhizobium sp. 41S5]